MTALPDWMVRSGEGLTVADYEALPEEVSRQIEILDGTVKVSPSPSRAHQRITRRLANALENAFEAADPNGLAVDFDVDLRLRDVPLLLRRPDVVVFDASLPGDEVLRPDHCLLVVEVMSPGSTTADRMDKPTEYAASGIEHFWRVEHDDQVINVFRYQLDPMTRTYALVGLDKGKLVINDPVELVLDLETLR
ncbi:Uma2 family endonuclease [Actinophytocola algeriensis]|uniref:Uma2 family endonuclease n=1 Tax=Actinophytocola algeriensis TaxID=1768010 RepID=A0A7W7QAV5_9PSEU|nr:Uma2 family endonuclease [Actinophytocola algeriensis]MBB4910265.1 Uma2 family endonuclease [Actinophytocola algeriensis]MBE1480746.1 Uma2 family endonuclease [Actinophytocola algeriensis]